MAPNKTRTCVKEDQKSYTSSDEKGAKGREMFIDDAHYKMKKLHILWII